ncbi:hypothetical protein LAZ67_4001859 [Cordylochernes scorpioides]|uniref:Peptidase S9 prolyl oligopeptidase catalytic domain-containing protein n=1 Tax=Cordylochernes scorpioides TaxID=51811 RepID=A0ABY6KCB3_9ARAC|nr:hypothetical protein LAZ67_4001859 [Cordylochernes scorpioides]
MVCGLQHITEEAHGWVDLRGAGPIFPPPSDGNFYFMRLSVTDGKAGLFHHVALVDLECGNVLCSFFISTLQDKPGERHLFSLRMPERNTTCVTCEIEGCRYAKASFPRGDSPRLYLLECLGPQVPWTELRNASDHSLVEVLDDNSGLGELIAVRAVPQVRTFLVPLPSGYKATVRLLLPPGLRDEEIIKYGLILHTDGAPGSQLVTEKFELDWGAYLASKQNFIYAAADCRGSGGQGRRRETELFRRLGNAEVEDQIEVVRYLKNSLPFVDSEKILIWGWGYGGYVAATALAMDGSSLHCALAVAPITSWFYHDAAFTERYLQSPRPEDNYIGYEKGDLLRRAENFDDKEFLLIHGTADGTNTVRIICSPDCRAGGITSEYRLSEHRIVFHIEHFSLSNF